MSTGARVWLTVGGILQLVGIFVLFVEISQTERLLRLRSWIRRSVSDVGQVVASVANRLGIRLRRPVVHELSGVGAGRASGSARVRVSRAEGSTVEERLDAHGRQLAVLREELDEVWQRVDRDQGEHRAALADLESRLGSEVSAVKELVTQLGGGSLRVRAFGGVLIFAGTAIIAIAAWL